MKYKLFICICLILFAISISSVSAMENNNESLSIDEASGLISSDANNNLGISGDNEIISTDVKGSFSDLRNAISSSNRCC